MLRRIRSTDTTAAEFCESCSRVCTRGCRARAQRDQARTSATALRAGLPF